MPRLIKIEENLKINYAKEIKEYLNPDNVYIPYEKKYNVDIKSNEYVLLNGLVLHNDDDYVYSPISGTIIGASESIVDGKKAPTIVIENDFKEKTYKVKGVLKNITNYKPNEFKNIIKIYNAYNGSLEGETLVISGIDYEPYEETMSFLIKSHTNEILECIDAISHILQIHKCFFAIKNNDSDNVKTLVDQIGTYPNINLKLMPDLYPIGQKDILINELVTEKKKDKGVIFLTVEDVFAIYNVLKKKKPITEKLITISGDLIDKPAVMLVKIGTNIGDIIANFFKVKDENFKIVINGLLSGYTIPSLNAVVTPLTRSIFITSEQQEKARKCINCGLCVLHCPVKANPKEKLRMDKCIKCGLCNYICPSKIKLMGGKKWKMYL